MAMNIAQARVVDPVLTSVVQGYKHAERVGRVLFPTVYVDVRGGKVLEFGREGFALVSFRRAPGANTPAIELGYEGKPYDLVQDALDAKVPREVYQDAKTVPGVDLQARAASAVMRLLTLALEDEQAQLATNPANYHADRKVALAGSDKWSDPDSDPIGDFDAAKQAVRLSAGVNPNRAVISNDGFIALKNHPKIVERFKYTSSDSITAGMLASLFDLDELAVGKAMMIDGNAADPAPFENVWNNCCVLAYAPSAPSGAEEPSFGYTYTFRGHPLVEPPYWDPKVKSWMVGVTYERRPVLTGILSGFLFTGIV